MHDLILKLKKEISRDISSTQEALLSGSGVNSIEDYRNLTGIIKGLSTALFSIDRIYKMEYKKNLEEENS